MLGRRKPGSTAAISSSECERFAIASHRYCAALQATAPTAVAPSSASPNTTTTPVLMSQIENFVHQLPIGEKWVTAPLNLPVPPTVCANAALLKNGLVQEKLRCPAVWRNAYDRSIGLTELIISVLREKEVFFIQSVRWPGPRLSDVVTTEAV